MLSTSLGGRASGLCRHAYGEALGAADRDLEATTLETVRILEKADRLDWDYDGEADVLYVSIGKPKKATGVDIGQGVIVRYDEKRRQVVGLTVMGIRARLLELTPPARTAASPARPSRRGRGAPLRGRA